MLKLCYKKSKYQFGEGLLLDFLTIRLGLNLIVNNNHHSTNTVGCEYNVGRHIRILYEEDVMTIIITVTEIG